MTTATDPFALTEAAAWTARIRDRDWHEVPKGHYAIEVLDWNEDDDGEWRSTLLGWTLWERRVPTVCKNGRTIGRHSFRRGAPAAADAATRERLIEFVQIDRHAWGADYLKYVVDEIMRDCEGEDTFRATYGRVTGHCGYCGRALTDPGSKMRGIGPECAKGLRVAIPQLSD